MVVPGARRRLAAHLLVHRPRARTFLRLAPAQVTSVTCCHRRDAGQRFTSETQRGQVIQVVGARDLARRMAVEQEGRVGRRDAAAVILDADQAPPTFTNLHPDVVGAGVQAILDQLLDHRCRAFHHLAGSDLVGDIGGKDLNWHGLDCTICGVTVRRRRIEKRKGRTHLLYKPRFGLTWQSSMTRRVV